MLGKPYKPKMHHPPKVLTVRGKTGAVVCAAAIQSEAAEHVAAALETATSAEERAQIVHVACDDPSGELFRRLKVSCASLQSISLDACHLVMKYESAQWRSAGCVAPAV